MKSVLLFFSVFGLGAISEAASSMFLAAEFFETIAPDIRRGEWPERVSFRPTDAKKLPDVEGHWRVFGACSGRPINTNESAGTKYFDGYHQASAELYFQPDGDGAYAARLFLIAPRTSGLKLKIEFSRSRWIKVTDGDGREGLTIEGNTVSTDAMYAFSLAGVPGDEVVLKAEDVTYDVETFQKLCQPHEKWQALLARVPNS